MVERSSVRKGGGPCCELNITSGSKSGCLSNGGLNESREVLYDP